MCTHERDQNDRAAKWLPILLGLCLSVVSLHLAATLIDRIRYPWDFYIWSESPFLTNLMKVERGEAIYGPIEDANSLEL